MACPFIFYYIYLIMESLFDLTTLIGIKTISRALVGLAIILLVVFYTRYKRRRFLNKLTRYKVLYRGNVLCHVPNNEE